MGRRYYCDYCDKTFIDDLDARKKHLQSAQHLRMRNLHYQQFRDPATILNEELLKAPCKRFLQYRDCKFGDNCKFTHYSPEELWQLRYEVETKVEREQQLKCLKEYLSFETWLKNYNIEDDKSVQTIWSYPENLEQRTDLPPSLKRMRVDDFVDDNFNTWG